MDAVSGAFLLIAQLIDNPISFSLVIFALVFITEKRMAKREKILFALMLSALLVFTAKNVLMEPRPCTSNGSLIPCPLDYSMPSGHAAVAFTLMLAYMGKPSFPLFWLFALLVSYSRFFLGVHTFDDIAAALVIAPVSYYITDWIWGVFVEGKQ
jgi:membrane-associated phospholipid phosphatase